MILSYTLIDFSPEDEVTVHAIIDECVKEIKEWLSDNFLLLNENKTEAMTVMPVNQSAVAKTIQLRDVTVPLSSTVTTLVQCSTKSAEWENMHPEFAGARIIIYSVFERLETA